MYYYGQPNPCGCYGNQGGGKDTGKSSYAYAMILVLFILLVIIGAARF